jgi:glycosyltransferase involved in cell wall biosynthesis
VGGPKSAHLPKDFKVTKRADSLALIIPSFNSSQFLPSLFSSIWGGDSSLGSMPGQTLLPTEVIVCDDASTDMTEMVVESYRLDHPELSYLRLNHNSGTPSACNEAIRSTNCKYIARIDSDDMREPESFERMMKVQLDNPHSMIYDDVRIFLKGQRQPQSWIMTDYDFEELLIKNTIHAGIMYPREAWVSSGGYPEEFREGRDDWSFNVALGVAGYCGVHVSYSGYLYRREEQNRSLRNKSEEWQKKFAMQMLDKFRAIYSGERPMGCCGNRSKNVKNAVSSGKSQNISTMVAGEVGMTILLYHGENAGSENYYGPATGVGYRFSKTKNMKNVDNRDLHTDNGTGLLDLHVGPNPLFTVYSA